MSLQVIESPGNHRDTVCLTREKLCIKWLQTIQPHGLKIQEGNDKFLHISPSPESSVCWQFVCPCSFASVYTSCLFVDFSSPSLLPLLPPNPLPSLFPCLQISDYYFHRSLTPPIPSPSLPLTLPLHPFTTTCSLCSSLAFWPCWLFSAWLSF